MHLYRSPRTPLGSSSLCSKSPRSLRTSGIPCAGPMHKKIKRHGQLKDVFEFDNRAAHWKDAFAVDRGRRKVSGCCVRPTFTDPRDGTESATASHRMAVSGGLASDLDENAERS